MTDIERLLAAIEAAPEGPQVGAFFDFDGTLIDGFSAVVYFRDRIRAREMDASELVHMLIEGFNVDRRGKDVTDLMTAAVGRLRGRTVADIERVSERLFRERISGMVFPDARLLIDAHRAKGHTVALASSATRFQAELTARDLGIDVILCTQIGEQGGLLTGLISGPILWGEGKATAVREYADSSGIDLSASFGYANGGEDVPFLSAVGRPMALNPDARLSAAAAARDWPTARLRPPAQVGPRTVARSIAAYTALAAGVAIGAGAGLIARSRTVAANTAAGLAGDFSLGAAGVSLEIVGEHNLWKSRPAVFLFNHQSPLDVMLVTALLRRDFAAVAKKELQNHPMFAPLGYLGGIAYIDRSNASQAREALQPVIDALRNGTSIAIAPEGTRSPTAELLPFKKGPLHIAMQAQVPIVPMVIRNAGEVMPAHSPWISPGVVQVAVLDPIPTTGWTIRDITPQLKLIRQAYVDTMADWPRAI